jgi:hypothetical protein
VHVKPTPHLCFIMIRETRWLMRMVVVRLMSITCAASMSGIPVQSDPCHARSQLRARVDTRRILTCGAYCSASVCRLSLRCHRQRCGPLPGPNPIQKGVATRGPSMQYIRRQSVYGGKLAGHSRGWRRGAADECRSCPSARGWSPSSRRPAPRRSGRQAPSSSPRRSAPQPPPRLHAPGLAPVAAAFWHAIRRSCHWHSAAIERDGARMISDYQPREGTSKK